MKPFDVFARFGNTKIKRLHFPYSLDNKNMSTIRTRIAPSPTGSLHIGTARTALFNYLFAKKHKGEFILRIEDTDLERSDKKFEKDIFEGLKWLGINADEDSEKGGAYGPYRQSERTQDYMYAIKKLLNDKKAFYCFHTEEELEKEKDELMALKKPILHLCEYRGMDQKEAELLTQTNSNFIIRFKTPTGRMISFNDLIRGNVAFESNLIGDFSIAKRIDVPLYNLAVVVDDEAMKISHVIRGEEHIANTPKQLLLIEALQFSIPIYAHLPLILGKDRSKLSKRDGATSIMEYRAIGYLPDALFNFIALLGWNPGDDKEILNKNDLINKFSFDHVQKSGAIFDTVKLDWMNGEYIRSTSIKELTQLCLPYLADAGWKKSILSSDMIEQIIALEQPRLKKLSELTENIDYFFINPLYDKELLRWKFMADHEIKEGLTLLLNIFEIHQKKDIRDIEQIVLQKASAMGDKGKLLWPFRVALTGKKNSPGPFEIMGILGVSEAIERIKKALRMVP